MNMRWAVCLLFLVAVCGCFWGCATMGSGAESVEISVSRSNEIQIHGRPVNVSNLGRKLKSMGATTRTRIIVAVQDDTSKETMTVVTRTLASEGFRRVVFRRPKQVESYSVH